MQLVVVLDLSHGVEVRPRSSVGLPVMGAQPCVLGEGRA